MNEYISYGSETEGFTILKEEKEMSLWRELSRDEIKKKAKDPFVSSTVKTLLENQKRMNESKTDTSDITQFKRISIPLYNTYNTKYIKPLIFPVIHRKAPGL